MGVGLRNLLWKYKALGIRALLCWILGSAFIFFDEVNHYDLRFMIRGAQPISKQIVLVTFDQEDWSAWPSPSHNFLRAIKEYNVMTDSFFWRSTTWNNLLGKILAQNPIGVGVTFFFNPDLPKPEESLRSLRDPRVIWAGQLDSDGHAILPLMANSYGYNVALVDLREDEDRVLRRFAAPLTPIPHMGFKLNEQLHGSSVSDIDSYLGQSRLINFRGQNLTANVHAIDVLQDRVPADFFKNKIVVIGTNSVPSHLYHTPIGNMNRAEVIAQIIDNIMNQRWIKRLPFWLSSVYLLGLLILAILCLVNYPQSVAFVFLVWLALGTTAYSIWIFDTFYFWIPALSPLIVYLAAYVVFISYQLSIKENQAWRLAQEKELLSELDQLRNNFVSLISHDLKTPIAKIQAICDRLLTRETSEEVKEGLHALRRESVELHRYIQSILQISRLESNGTEVRKEATDLNEVVERAVDQLKPLASDKRQSLVSNLEPLFSIEVDGILIQEVILNLVENAIKYTPNDGTIEISTQEIDDKVLFTVRDNGPGVPLQDRDRLFEKFFRGHAHKGATKGTGLGLFLVKYFIELHGGEVFLESEVGRGTRVGFTLPLQA